MDFSPQSHDEMNDLPLADSLDNAILMHRDSHFGGSFDFMLDYYNKGGKGVNPDFDLARIETLAEMEKKMGENLAGMLLSGPEAEKVAASKEAYKKLRELYEDEDPKNKNARLLADLILSEEDEPEKEIAAIAAEKAEIVRPLIDLLRSEEFYDPLFPGYGHAPMLAAKCLGRIGDRRAIISLFEAVGTGDFFDEDTTLAALKAIGEPAKKFLLKVLHAKPINEDNERAAIGLLQFKEDPEVSTTCFKMLQDPLVRKDLPLATYLIMACEHLNQTPLKNEFISLANDPQLNKMLKQDMQAIIHGWQ